MTIGDPQANTRRRLGGWLPGNEQALVAFRAALAARVRTQATPATLCPPVQELATLVDDDPVLRMDLTRAIEQALAAGHDLGYHTVAELMALINAVMTQSLPFDTTALVGCPINALLDWPMCMPSGFALFRSPAFNARMRGVLDHWSRFLGGPGSRDYLDEKSPSGWFSPLAGEYVDMKLFECDPEKPHWGFSSWNDFFTRRFKPGARPVAHPDDPKWIVSACEATPYAIQMNAALQDTFWIKGQPYSLQDMFTAARKDLAGEFVGGSVYQAFLSAYNYHRWHAPVEGTITDAYLVGGTYYSDVASAGPDPAGPNDSQGYITAVAARAVIVIDTGRPGMGKVACVFVGMAEISSCVIEVERGQRVKKGDEVGYFQYGGSTHCVIFQRGVIQSFVPQPPFNESTPIVQLGSPLAFAR